MPPQYSKPAVFLPFDVLHLICKPLKQSDRLAFLRASRSWYTAGYTLLLTSMEFKLPISGELPKYNYNRRWNIHESLDLLPKTLHISDPIRKIYSQVDKLFDSVSRINRDLSSVLLVPTNLLVNIRSVQIHSQLINVCGPCFHGSGVRHTWVYDLIPYLLLHCPMLDDMEVEIESAWYQMQVAFPPHWAIGINPIFLQNSGVIGPTGAQWASSTSEWADCFWSKYVKEWNEKQLCRKLSRLSIALTGRAYSPTTYALKNIWYILATLGVLDNIDEIEVKNLHTFVPSYLTATWFAIPTPGYVDLSKFQARSVRRLELEGGEDHKMGFGLSLRQIKTAFPNLENLSIATVGIFLRKDLAFLDSLITLKELSITEISNPELEKEEGPDSMHATNLLVECMELILNPPNLQRIKWNRGGYQRAHGEIYLGDLKQIEFVDIWLTIGEEKVLIGERYDSWYFREELFYGIGCEDRWGSLWMKRFLSNSEMMEPVSVEDEGDGDQPTQMAAS